MASRKDEDFSKDLSKTLDMMALSISDVRTVQRTIDAMTQNINEVTLQEGFLFTTVGSKSEGVSLSDRFSDYDFMVSPSPNISLSCDYKLRFSNSPPGYIQLQIFNQCEENQYVYCTISKRTYAPSITASFATAVHDARVHGPRNIYDLTKSTTNIGLNLISFDQLFGCLHVQGLRRTGPSLKLDFERFGMDINNSADYVLALPCKVPHYLHLWCNRRRNHSLFPTKDQIQEISEMDAHVVPIGCKKTDTARLDWRICFTLAEIALVRSFNATQYKVYATLKMLAKSAIEHVCPSVTSYVMKNVILWVSELFPISMFEETNLSNCLVMCLHFLRQCIRNRYLPNYMIPDRDLLFRRLNNKRVKALNRVLCDLISEGGGMVLRCEHLRTALRVQKLYPILSEVSKKMKQSMLLIFSRLLEGQLCLNMNACYDKILNLLEGDLSTSNLPTCIYYFMLTLIMRKTLLSQAAIRHSGNINIDERDILNRLIHLDKQLMDRFIQFCIRLATNIVQNSETNGELNSDIVDEQIEIFQNIDIRNTIDSNLRQWFERLIFASATEQNQLVHQMLNYLQNK